MRKPLALLLTGCLLAACSNGRPRVDRTVEDGVEVVLNHRTPYRVPGEASALTLEPEFTIDAEAPELLAAGLTDIRQFGVDSRGAIYILQSPRKDAPFIFKFDSAGRLERSFGRWGQGPGEIERSSYSGVNSRDELFCLDSPARKILTFGPSGELVGEVRLSSGLVGAIPLDNGSYLNSEYAASDETGFEDLTFYVLDKGFAKIKAFYRFRIPVQFPGQGKKVDAFYTFPTGTFTPESIILGLSGPDYEILVFDLQGTLRRRIRKEYAPVEITAAYRRQALAGLPQNSPMAGSLEFPRARPAYQYLFADEAGRIFAMTAEKDGTSGRNICDIFNPSGVFIGRAAIGAYDRFRHFWEGVSLDVVAKNGRIYMLRDKADGYKELIVNKAHWGHSDE
jgi:hypothetical protein